jgi:hypothetical protein
MLMPVLLQFLFLGKSLQILMEHRKYKSAQKKKHFKLQGIKNLEVLSEYWDTKCVMQVNH